MLTRPGHGQFRGLVLDESRRPVAFAGVQLRTLADSTLVQGGVADTAGRFTLSAVPAGQYLLSITRLGYLPYSGPVHVFDTLGPGTYTLREDAQSLHEVVVRGERPLYEQQADRLVVHVQHRIAAVGGTALDLLQQMPGVAVNPQQGTLSLNGKGGVSILLNGKPANLPAAAVLEMLRGLNGGTLDRIELMTHPTAGYDAEGAGGAINIVLRQPAGHGTSGTGSVALGYGYGEKADANFSVHHRGPKLSLFGTYAFSRNRSRQFYDFYRTFGSQGGLAFTGTESDRRPVVTNQSFRVGFEHQLRPGTTLSGLAAGFSNHWRMRAFNQTVTRDALQNSLVRGHNTEVNHWRNLMGNLHLTRVFREGHELRLDADYLAYHNTNPSDYAETYSDSGGEPFAYRVAALRKETPLRVGVARLEYRRAPGKVISWEAGIKGTASWFVNDVQYRHQQDTTWVMDPALTQRHELRETIGAAYVSGQVQASPATKVVAGLRLEYTRTQLRNAAQEPVISRRYASLFPNLAISHKLSEQRAIHFSFARRITRPAFTDLAPFVIFYGANNFESGNPALQPSLLHTWQVQYQWQEFAASLQYGREARPIAGYQPHVDPTTYSLFNYAENLSRAQDFTLSLVLPWRITSWWSAENAWIAVRHSVRAAYAALPEKLVNYNVRLTCTQRLRLPAGFSGELFGYYQSPFLFGVYRQRSTGALNVSVQKKWKPDGGTLSLTWEDVFWTTTGRWQYDRPAQHLQSNLSFTLGEPRVVKLTYSHSFGAKRLQTTPSRGVGSEEEQKRINQ